MLCSTDSDVDLEDLSSEMSRIVFEKQSSVTEVIDLTEVGLRVLLNVQLCSYGFYHSPLCIYLVVTRTGSNYYNYYAKILCVIIMIVVLAHVG